MRQHPAPHVNFRIVVPSAAKRPVGTVKLCPPYRVRIVGMTCEACAAHIASELRKVPGVSEANVNHEKGTALVVASPAVGEFELRRSVNAADYSILYIGKTTKTNGKVQK